MLLFLWGAALFGGCSLDPGFKGGNLEVHLRPKDPITNDFSLLATPTSLSSLNCFGLNVRGGTVGTSGTCNGLVQSGILAGSVGSRPTSFSVIVPSGIGTVFEAFGFQAASCPDLGSVLSSGIPNDSTFNGHVYRIGSVTTNLSTTTASVTIDTSFDSNLGFQCSTGASLGRTLAVGSSYACASSSSGVAYCWGANSNGQLGNNSTASSSVPTIVSGVGGSGQLADVAQVAAGQSFACARNSSGQVFCWGSNAGGALGNNSTVGSNSPVQVVGPGNSGFLSGVSHIATGTTNACGVTTSGLVHCWGSGTNGELGQNSSTGSMFPVTVLGVGGTGTLTGVTQVAGGSAHYCATNSSGGVHCWGYNLSGQLGDNSSIQRNAPVQVVGVGGTGTLSSISSVAASPDGQHVCALSNTGTVYCWGNNSNGQLGDNSSIQRTYPVQVVGIGGTGTLSGISKIAVGQDHSCATTTGGDVYCWGSNASGKLGINSTAGFRMYPDQVVGVGGSGTLQAATPGAGLSHSCAVNAAGAVYCWGSNGSGALGNNSTSASNTPVQVSGVGGAGSLSL